jgi:putative ABC transport system permease protein
MRALDLVATANRNLLRSKLRTILTISAIFVGAFTLTLTTALGAGAQQYLNRQLGDVTAPGVFFVTPKADVSQFVTGSQPRTYDPNKQRTGSVGLSSLGKTDIDKLKTVGGVRSVDPYYSLAGEYVSGSNDTATKYASPTLTQYTNLSLDLSAGRVIGQNDTTGVILPDNYAGPLGFGSPQAAISKTIRLAYKTTAGKIVTISEPVLGVMKKTFFTSGQMYITNAEAATIAKAQNQDQHFIATVVVFKDATTDENMLKQRLTSSGNYNAVSLKERINTVTTVISAITTGLNVVGVIALFAASFGIINTLLMSVYERTQEIGLMKALGMHRRAVFALFALEAVLVGFWGSVVATLAGWGVAQAVSHWASNSFLKDFEGFTLLVVTPFNALFVVALIMVIAFVAGTLPAIKAARLNPIEALRSE